MADNLRIIIVMIMINTSRTSAEQLTPGIQLLVHFEARPESYPLIIIKRCFLTTDITNLLTGLFVVL